MFNRQSFGGRLKMLRGNVSQEEFGETLGVSQTYINHLETGRRGPTVEFLLKLSYETRKSTDSLLKGAEFKPRDADEKLSFAMGQFVKKLKSFEKDLDNARENRDKQEPDVAWFKKGVCLQSQ